MELPSILETVMPWLIMIPLMLTTVACAVVPVFEFSVGYDPHR